MKCRKKPVEIETIQYTGDNEKEERKTWIEKRKSEYLRELDRIDKKRKALLENDEWMKPLN
jgi:hypothetical protein